MTQGLGRLSKLKDGHYLGIEGASFDGELKSVILAASEIANTFTARTLQLTAYTDELYTGTDTDSLYLNQYPVVEVTAVSIWDGTDSYDTETDTYYVLVSDRYLQYPALGQETYATYSYWPKAYHNGIKVTYKAGYITDGWETLTVNDTFGVPADLEHAVLLIAMKIYKDGTGHGGRFGMASVTRMGDGVVFGSDKFMQGIPTESIAILNNYRGAIF